VVVVKRLWLCWLWFAHASGIVLISLAIGWMLISWFATTQPVIQPVGLAQLENARVPVGGVFVDGPGGVLIGSNRVNVTYDPRAFTSIESYGTAGLVQNSWREVKAN
jgi:hypothetical protein